MQDAMSPKTTPIHVEPYYYFGYGGRSMLAIRSPFSMSGEAAPLIGQRISTGSAQHIVVAVSRQISGPIQEGEPIGVEISAAPRE